MSTTRTITAKILVEAGDDFSLDNLIVRYVVPAVKQSCKTVRGGAVVISLAEDGRFLGTDVSGTPSEEMREVIEDLTGEEAVRSL